MRADGCEFVMGKVSVNEMGDVVGCACETYQVKTRVEEALGRLAIGDEMVAIAFLRDLLREVERAEILKAPMPVFRREPRRDDR